MIFLITLFFITFNGHPHITSHQKEGGGSECEKATNFDKRNLGSNVYILHVCHPIYV